MEKQKTLKEYCKEAKKRLKQGFWQNYQKKLSSELVKAEENGLSKSKVKEYYQSRVTENIKHSDNEGEEFYQKVKKLLEEEGEVSNALGRLTETEYYNTLSYEEQQSYNLRLSEKYLQAVTRFNREKEMPFKIK